MAGTKNPIHRKCPPGDNMASNRLPAAFTHSSPWEVWLPQALAVRAKVSGRQISGLCYCTQMCLKTALAPVQMCLKRSKTGCRCDPFYFETGVFFISRLLFLSSTTGQKQKYHFSTSLIRYDAASTITAWNEEVPQRKKDGVFMSSSNIFQWLQMRCSSSLGCICAVKSDEFRNWKQVCV